LLSYIASWELMLHWPSVAGWCAMPLWLILYLYSSNSQGLCMLHFLPCATQEGFLFVQFILRQNHRAPSKGSLLFMDRDHGHVSWTHTPLAWHSAIWAMNRTWDRNHREGTWPLEKKAVLEPDAVVSSANSDTNVPCAYPRP
jgi:hypothetical protein